MAFSTSRVVLTPAILHVRHVWTVILAVLWRPSSQENSALPNHPSKSGGSLYQWP